MKTIYILWIRQIIRFWRSKPRLFGSLGQPLLFLLAFGFGFGPVFAQAGRGNYLSFLAPGVICQTIIFTSIFSGIEIIWDRQFGFLKETLVAPVSRLSIMAGRTLGGSTVAVFQGVIAFCLSLLVGFCPVNWWTVPLAFLIMIMTSLLFTAVGTAIASVMSDFHGFQIIMNLLVMPLYFLSGALFPLDNLPPVMKTITRLNPLTYCVDGLRGVLLGAGVFSLGFDLLVIFSVLMFFLFLGSYLFSKIQI